MMKKIVYPARPQKFAAAFKSARELNLDAFFRDAKRCRRFTLGKKPELSKYNDLSATHRKRIDGRDKELNFLFVAE